MSLFKGRAAYIFEDNFDIDMIIGIENISVSDMDKILDVIMKDYDKNFRENIKEGDILIGGKNFGYGHPHPQAMIAMRKLGIEVIVAESFAFPFYRSELASGMKLFECPGITDNVTRWDTITIDVKNGILINETKELELKLKDIPDIALDMMESGGVVGYLKRKTNN